MPEPVILYVLVVEDDGTTYMVMMHALRRLADLAGIKVKCINAPSITAARDRLAEGGLALASLDGRFINESGELDPTMGPLLFGEIQQGLYPVPGRVFVYSTEKAFLESAPRYEIGGKPVIALDKTPDANNWAKAVIAVLTAQS